MQLLFDQNKPYKLNLHIFFKNRQSYHVSEKHVTVTCVILHVSQFSLKCNYYLTFSLFGGEKELYWRDCWTYL